MLCVCCVFYFFIFCLNMSLYLFLVITIIVEIFSLSLNSLIFLLEHQSTHLVQHFMTAHEFLSLPQCWFIFSNISSRLFHGRHTFLLYVLFFSLPSVFYCFLVFYFSFDMNHQVWSSWSISLLYHLVFLLLCQDLILEDFELLSCSGDYDFIESTTE